MRKFLILIIGTLAALLFCSAQAKDITTIEQAQEQKDLAHTMAECARALDLEEDDTVILTAQKIWWEADAAERELNEQDTGYSYTTPEQWAEHPVAAEVYEYLRGEMGLSPAVAAGIIGGWMEECGGQTLNLQYWIYGGSGKYTYYGLAMWSMLYCPEIGGATLEQQLDYFAQTARKNVEYFGGSWDYFTSLTDPGAVVSYYYTYYGRGYGSASRQRVRNGYTAQSYFGGA